MRRIFPALVFACFLCALPAHADEASKKAKVQHLLVLTKSDAMMDKMLAQMTTAIKSSATEQVASLHLTPAQQPALDAFNARIAAILKSALNMQKVKPILVKVYMENYTEAELDGIIAFYTSPAGQAFVSKGPQVMQQSIQLMEKQMSDVEPQLEQASKYLTDSLAKSPAKP